ncbi:MAG: S1 domain-containing RNA-binding protein [Furfurilactobacillus sp.]|jgi:S1 RNA binding domain protein|uniref:S1 domain-containing RNA-binding protein n=2 Tax=Furfurilactobacillus TaxID=2767882 RepID=A0ABT6D7H5_9LACO|nr:MULTISPECIES: S1 domain-containing RNA-binding protein [Furfurilactobacillus]QLE65978.1 RNA binding protein contains ribosomal protein S1 [Furfurilactobacillus rossiae]MCF6160117.1 RNA-binding protein S1 [Furfurilactobacillus milii]MCF6162060.1 RNA-binding protein S1 [Furfurilactobacillus milii]MCF6420291.1 RNA-binding protein S1 [Furfurilactobacillus milii]MCH4012498.1 S1 domain-containing RNA-binding protein [Furfurilactobacillus sp.]
MAVEVGNKVSGKVTGITNFGAFVDLGEHQSGLVHISQISNEYIKDIHDVLNVGDEVTVKVLSMEKGKIALSMKAAEDRPATTQSHGEHSRGGNHEHHENHEGHEFHNGGHDNHSNNHGRNEHGNSRGGNRGHQPDNSFDGMMASFLKDSEQRLATLKHNTEGKRGGRGGRRS